jgi:hypothetical protein
MPEAVVETTVVPEAKDQPGEQTVTQPTLGNPEGAATDQPTDEGVIPAAEGQTPEGKPKEEHYARRLNRFMNQAAQLKAENLALQAQITGKAPQNQEPAKPTREQYASNDAYIQAQVDFQISQKLPEIQAKLQQATQRSTAETSFQSRENELRKTHADYDDVIAEASHIPVQPIVADAIIQSDMGPDIRYHLAQNPDLADKLFKMHPARAAVEIGKIEAQLSRTTDSPAPRAVSRAPAPIRSVISNGVTVTQDLEKGSMEDYVRTRNKQRRDLGRQY